MEPTQDRERWRDRIKNTVKEREIQKTLVSHWNAHRETYVVTAIGVVGTFLLTKRATSSETIKQRSLFGENTIVFKTIKKEEM